MKYLRQFGIILAVTCAGEIMKYFIPLPIPGSIYGLILMFVLLLLRVIKVEHVKETGEFLIEIMPLMFIPAGVGLITSWEQLQSFHGAASGDHSRVYICSYDRDWKSDRLLNFENRERRKEVVWTI